MIETVDGRAARDGRSATLGGEADLQRLLELRTIADAVLIGTGTLRAEGYDRLVRSEERRARRRAAGLAEDPLAVILSRRFDLPWEAGLFQAPEQPVLIYTGPGRGRAARRARPGRGGAPRGPEPDRDARRPARARRPLAALARAGRRMHRALLAAGLVDELYLTITPLITGDADEPNIVEGGRLPDAVELELLEVERVGSELFLRYGRAS